MFSTRDPVHGWRWPFLVVASREKPMPFEAWLSWRHQTSITSPPPEQPQSEMLAIVTAALA